MANFSGEQALASGFRVIFRNPAAIAAWAVFYLVVGLGPMLLVLGPSMAHPVAYNPGDPQSALAAMSRMMIWFPFIWLLAICHAAVAYSAVYRSVLMPEDRQYFYLRLSRRELWLGLTMLALLVLFMACILIASITIALLSRSAPGLVTFLAIVGAIVGAGWLGMRFSMATPMAFAEQRFILMESWRLTQGLGWKLFGVAVCLVVIVLAIEIVLMIPIMIALSLTGAFKALASAAEAGQGATYPIALVVAYLVILPILAALMYAILAAPWANIYQQLTAPDAEAAP
ncbi:MAG TPA: hypothetical protein VHN39_09105 [Phenylobacterium sp.]|jgi:hypothetical protein|nr:hypothetical protein [Phenylobacterium sp.]